MVEIVDISEIIEMLGVGSSITDPDRSRLNSIKNRVENAVRRFVGHAITQPATPYVHYVPTRPNDFEYNDFVQSLPSGKVTFTVAEQWSDVLQLPQIWLRSIVEVREDVSAFSGGASIFSSDTLLTENTDYRADWDEPGFCRAAQLVRVGTMWPAAPRTVRVIYVAGLTAAELDGEYSDIKDVVIEETVSRFNMARARSGTAGGVGPIKSEMIGNEYSVTYDTSDRFTAAGGHLSVDSREKLERFLNLSF